jgi:D-alanyl-D-alanine carboxypeptidase
MARAGFKRLRNALPAILLLSGVFSGASVAQAYSPPFSSIVLDVNAGQVLHEVDADEFRHPASITKVMTLFLVFEQLRSGALELDTPLRVSLRAAAEPPTKVGVRAGGTIRVEDAIKALVTRSANDVATVIAENLSGSVECFASEMTRKARQIGMDSTVFRNPHGLPDYAQVTTARDLAILALAVQDRFPEYYKYFQTRDFQFNGSSYGNHNRLLGRVEGVDGIKTGFIRASGFNLMTNAKTEDRHVVTIVLGGRTAAHRDKVVTDLVKRYLPLADAGDRSTPATGFARAAGHRAVAAAIALPPVRPHDLAPPMIAEEQRAPAAAPLEAFASLGPPTVFPTRPETAPVVAAPSVTVPGLRCMPIVGAGVESPGTAADLL